MPKTPQRRKFLSHSCAQTVFLGLQFRSTMYDRSELVAIVEQAVEMAETDLQKKYSGIRVDLIHQLTPGEPINSQIIAMVRSATVGVFEVSDSNPNVYFESGLAYICHANKPLLLYNTKAAKNIPVASDVRDIVRLEYRPRQLARLTGRIANHIKASIDRQIKQEAKNKGWDDLKKVWGGTVSPRQITIVCPTLPTSYQPKYAKAGSPEFMNLARFGDVDSLVQILTMFPKLFPNAEVKYITSEELQRSEKPSNLIVIGGPDFNTFAAEILNSQSFPFRYCTRSGTAELLHLASKRRFPLIMKKLRVCQDYGLFARFPNPLNKANSIIMIGGLQTFGVLGAVQAFSMNSIGRSNVKRIMRQCSRSPYFAVLAPVDVSGTQIVQCDIDMTTFQIYPW